MSSSKIILDANWEPKGYEQVGTLTSAVGLKVKGRAALIQAEGDDVRWRDDGTDPDATTGMLLLEGQDMFYTGDLYAIKFIETTGSGKLNVSYYETPERQV
jgi:hypothetical protein